MLFRKLIMLLGSVVFVESSSSSVEIFTFHQYVPSCVAFHMSILVKVCFSMKE